MHFPGRVWLFCTFAALWGSMPLVRAEDEPAELQQARAQFQKEEEFALRPLRDRYVARLQTIKRTLATRGDVRAAVTVQDEIDTVQAIVNEPAIRAKLVGTWTGQFKDGPRRYTVRADGGVDWLHPNGTVAASGRVLRDGKDFIFSWDGVEEVERVSLTEAGAMAMDVFAPKTTYPKGSPAFRGTLTRSASNK
jgi:hypothetical protein